MRRLPSSRRVKRHFSYTVKELAKLLQRTPATIRDWIAAGLKPVDRTRPQIIEGSEVHRFLEERRNRDRKSCRPGEMFCVACREVREPAHGEAEYIPITALSGNLRARCPVCANLIHRRVAKARIDAVRGSVRVQVQQAEPRLIGMAEPSLSPHFATEC